MLPAVYTNQISLPLANRKQKREMSVKLITFCVPGISINVYVFNLIEYCLAPWRPFKLIA